MIRGKAFPGWFLAAALVFCGIATAATPPAKAPTLKAGSFDPPRAAPAFAIDGSDGRPLTLAAHRGKVVLLAFGFSHCGDVCPVTLATLKAAVGQLGDDAGGVQVIYVTVDPARDTPPRMAEYLAFFDPRFLGGSGTEARLAAMRRDYGVAAAPVSGTRDFSHSSFVYLIDRAGRLRALMPYGRAAADYVHDVRVLLAEP